MFQILFKVNNAQASHRKKIFILTALTFLALC